MKKLEKIELTQKIARELQSRMTFREIDTYLQEFQIDVSQTPYGDSKYDYVVGMLAGRPVTVISEMAEELQIDSASANEEAQGVFRFWKIGYFRIFISHTSANKEKVSRLARALLDRGCVCFVAHEDIKPSLEWRQEILRALRSTDALVAVLTDDFHASEWTDHEVGIALGRGKLVVPVMAGVKAYGFLEQFQGKKSAGQNTGQVADAIIEAISSSTITSRKFADTIIAFLVGSKTSEELAKWTELARRLDSFDLPVLRALRDQLSNDPSVVGHIPAGLEQINTLLASKGIERVPPPKARILDFDDEIPF